MAKLFGYPINVKTEEEEDGGRSSINEEISRSTTQPDGEAMSLSAGLPQRESNLNFRSIETNMDSGSIPMESESDLDSCFIDFFGRESHDVDTAGEVYTGRNQMLVDDMEKIDLGLGIGAGSGSVLGQLRDDSVSGDKEIDSGRVEVARDLTPLEDDLFCEEEAMLMADEVLEWENLQNDITWDSEPVQATLFTLEEDSEEEEEEEEEEEDAEEEEEEEGDELALPFNTNPFLHNLESQVFYEESLDITVDALEDTELMDLEYEDFFLYELGEGHGDYYDVFAQTFDQEPPPIMGTRPASKKVIDELPVVEITSEESSKGNIVCAICISDVVVEEKVTRLPCRHYYHGECIVPWLGMRNTCPVCRFELPTDDLEYERSRR